MYKEIISLADIPQFQTRAEEFFPLEWYRKMLNESPVYYHEGTNTWNVFKYDDVNEVISNYEIFSSEGSRTAIDVGTSTQEGAPPDKIAIALIDPPRHRKYRALLSTAFTPRSLKSWEPKIEQIVNRLVDEMKPGEVDIVNALAGPLPTIVMADLFGVPSQDHHLFKEWVDVLFQPNNGGDRQALEQKKLAAAQAYYQHIYPIVLEKRSNPTDDIMSDLLKAEVDGEAFTDDEVVRTTMLFLGAGIETTSHMLSSIFYSFLYDDPALYQQLQNQPAWIPNTVEEMLRYRFHISKRERTVKQDNNILGVNLKKGDVVVAWMSAANMDDSVFEDPFTLNIHRENSKKHLTFGKGPHFCLGAPLARLELNIALNIFTQKVSKIEPIPFDLESSLAQSAAGQSLVQLPMKIYK